MKHYGDITKISGYDVPTVDIITGGSPCQDLSVAGKRAGLAGERSGLFMEQIRVIKEMRERSKAYGRADELIQPRWMVFENVPGLFSSNGGEDFRCVLEETARVKDEDAVIPGYADGKWPSCGLIVGNGYSIAWRVHDAQFWGVPQRRKRVCVLADFNGESAGRILFELRGETVNGKAD
jgi:DNA (cytosine-5)-methyltransferase 1